MASGPCTSESAEPNFNANTVGCKGNTPLHEVVKRVECSDPKDVKKIDEMHIQYIKLLLKFNPDVNVQNSEGFTPLHLAIKNERSLDVLKSFTLYHKADDLNATDGEGCAALYHAVFPTATDYDVSNAKYNFNFRDVGIVKHLVEKGAKMNTVAMNGYSPLLLAVVMKKTDYVKTMLENGLKQSEGGLEKMASSFCLRQTRFTGRHYKSDSYPSSEYYNMTPLLISVYDCNQEMAQMLIKAGASVNAVNSIGENSLHMISNGTIPVKKHEQQEQIAKLLIDNGIDLNAKDQSGGTALNYAIRNNKHIEDTQHTATEQKISVDLTQTIIDHGANTNATDAEGCTALYHAVFPTTTGNGQYLDFRFRDVAIVKLLVAKGAKIDTVAKNGYSPLLLAVVLKKYNYVKTMLENVSNLSEGGLEQTTSAYCLNSGRRTYPSDEYYNLTPLLISVYDCNKEMTQMLIKAGASVNAVNSSGKNSLHMITNRTIPGNNQEQQGQIAKLLIENGIDLNAKDNSGGTALNYAITNDKYEIVIYILEKGLDTL